MLTVIRAVYEFKRKRTEIIIVLEVTYRNYLNAFRYMLSTEKYRRFGKPWFCPIWCFLSNWLEVTNKYEKIVAKTKNVLKSCSTSCKTTNEQKYELTNLEWPGGCHRFCTFEDLKKLRKNVSYPGSEESFNLLKLAKSWKVNEDTSWILRAISRRCEQSHFFSPAERT